MPKLSRAIVIMSEHAANLHWLVFASFATLPNMAPAARLRASKLAEAYHKFALGLWETDDYPELSNDKDALAGLELEAWSRRAPILITVSYLSESGRELYRLRETSAYQIVEAARRERRYMPPGLFIFLREAVAGDRAQFYVAQSKLAVYAEIIKRDAESIKEPGDTASIGSPNSKSHEEAPNEREHSTMGRGRIPRQISF